MPALAFKIAQRAVELNPGPGSLFTVAIENATGSPFSHVELWLKGQQSSALCFSSREPDGTGWATIGLTDQTLWKIIPLPPMDQGTVDAVSWFCNGSSGRHYDSMGIVGILDDNSWHSASDRFCSEMVMDIGQSVLGWRTDIPRWHVAPGWTKGGNRYGLYELATGGKLAHA